MSEEKSKETKKLVISKVLTLLIVWLPKIAEEIINIITGGN